MIFLNNIIDAMVLIIVQESSKFMINNINGIYAIKIKRLFDKYLITINNINTTLSMIISMLTTWYGNRIKIKGKN